MLSSWERNVIFLGKTFHSSYIGENSGSQPKHELIIESTNSENQESSGETMSVDSNHYGEKDGDENFHGNEDTLDEEKD
ncbi:hypothetical protein JTB14_012686 [Gonioctena quinquepunctata]|nr:hypothetical protein JTB14_012686 [Gonioctena quinquepunctata]